MIVSSESSGRLVLWDVDLTLVDARGLGAGWYAAALAEATGRALESMPDTAGRTERAIATDVLELHGVPLGDDVLNAMFAALADAVVQGHDELSLRGSAMPGAARALSALASGPGVVQTVVTGNLPAVAFAKLDAFGLHRHLDFEIGGFGADSMHRHELVATSVAKAATKHEDGFDAVVVFGDTPHDVTGALRSGAVAVGVATGHSSEEDLRKSGAHVVLPDLTDADAVLAAVHES